MMHLAFTERAILADEMGLGKTVQAVAACELLRRLRGVSRVLVVTPTSLKAEWQEQIEKFSGLPVTMVYGPRAERLRHYQSDSFFIVANYEQVVKDFADIQRLAAPDIVVLDEAQRIKNWRTKTASVIKELKSRYAFVLTGTPVENRIDDIYSIVQFLDPHIFGSLFRFNREFYRLDEKGRPAGYQNLDRLHQRLKPVLLRRRKSDVEGQLPGRTVSNHFVPMSDEQKARYADYADTVAKLAAAATRRPLQDKEFKRLQMSLAAMRMLCDTPYILDEKCRVCPKLEELDDLLEEALAEPDNKIIIFSEWERMLSLIREKLEERGVGFAWHTGAVDQKKRPAEIRRFKDDPECRVFLSTDSGSVGLNLQAANIVINVDLPWNPAKLEQRIARAWRKHQTRTVHVINLVSEHTIEHRMLGVLKLKQAMADNVLEEGGDSDMVLPSGRAAMVKRLNEMMGNDQAGPAPSPKATEETKEETTDPLDRFREETVAKLEPRLRRFEAYPGEEGRKTILAVVDGAPEGPKEQMRETLERTGLGQSAALEVLDRATFETIERLVKAGVLSFNAANAAPLHRAAANAPSEQDLRRKRAGEARTLLRQAERGEKLAALLENGGFCEESRPPCREIFGLFMQAFARYQGRESAGLPDAGFPPGILAFAARLHDESRPWDRDTAAQAMAALRETRRFVEDAIDGAARDRAA
jgi:superfamily II DNA/RNA helicase